MELVAVADAIGWYITQTLHPDTPWDWHMYLRSMYGIYKQIPCISMGLAYVFTDQARGGGARGVCLGRQSYDRHGVYGPSIE